MSVGLFLGHVPTSSLHRPGTTGSEQALTHVFAGPGTVAQLGPTVMTDPVSHCRLSAAGWPCPGYYKGKEEEVTFYGRQSQDSKVSPGYECPARVGYVE